MYLKNGSYFLLTSLILISCGRSYDPPPSDLLPNGSILAALSGPNVISLGINGSHCLSNSAVNVPCVSVKICSTTGSNCITVPYLLVDTGSTGLRIFKSVLEPLISNNTIQPVTLNGNPLAECVQFGDKTNQWGPVYQAGVILGGESVVSVPIQVIDPNYATMSGGCAQNRSTTDQNPDQTGFNGILGINLSAQDCRSCIGMYYTCNGNSCTRQTPPLSNQLTNPISKLAVDNNGAVLMLPSIPFGGVRAIEGGYLVLGIDTQNNNSSSQVTSYAADSSGYFLTDYQGQTIEAFLDSGSNAYYFPSSTNECQYGFYCPSSLSTMGANIISNDQKKSSNIPFFISNAENLFQTPNKVFLELGGSGAQFDWGLPFYIGRNVFVGIENTSSSLGQGPYWGF